MEESNDHACLCADERSFDAPWAPELGGLDSSGEYGQLLNEWPVFGPAHGLMSSHQPSLP